MLKKVKSLLNIGRELKNLPTEDVQLNCNTPECESLYKSFTKPHSKFPLIKAKTHGIALIPIHEFENAAAFIGTISGKNSAAYFSRKAERSGYSFSPFKENDELDSIYSINTSSGERQGNTMSSWYTSKHDKIELADNYYCRGIYHEERLVAYAFIGVFGELAIISNILGHKDHLKGGVMYLLLTGLCSEIADQKKAKFIMYDTLLGASPGLRMFKERCGFNAYKVNWIR